MAVSPIIRQPERRRIATRNTRRAKDHIPEKQQVAEIARVMPDAIVLQPTQSISGMNDVPVTDVTITSIRQIQ